MKISIRVSIGEKEIFASWEKHLVSLNKISKVEALYEYSEALKIINDVLQDNEDENIVVVINGYFSASITKEVKLPMIVFISSIVYGNIDYHYNSHKNAPPAAMSAMMSMYATGNMGMYNNLNPYTPYNTPMYYYGMNPMIDRLRTPQEYYCGYLAGYLDAHPEINKKVESEEE